MIFRRAFVAVVLLLVAVPSMADAVRVAVASNFAGAMLSIAGQFEAATGYQVTLSAGSTGKHYAQIINGAPFDAFFAADTERPELLEVAGETVPGTRFTYALGRVILWSPDAGYVDPEGEVLEHGGFRFLAIANPKLAPYGKAAREVLQARGLWELLRGRMVQGENIGQAYQFVRSGNAELGFVAWSQVQTPGRPVAGSYWEVPQAFYTPIQQQAVLLKDSEAARALLTFVRSGRARRIIRYHGYQTP